MPAEQLRLISAIDVPQGSCQVSPQDLSKISKSRLETPQAVVESGLKMRTIILNQQETSSVVPYQDQCDVYKEMVFLLVYTARTDVKSYNLISP